MIVILGDLIADLSLRISRFPIRAQDLQAMEYIDLGPGGACNVAIMVRRFGLPVCCLGEIGRDAFGNVVVEGLEAEGIDTAEIYRNDGSVTPVAGVVVDQAGEPGYLGYPGRLTVTQLPESWRSQIEPAQGLYADGWIEYAEAGSLILDAFQIARSRGVPTFFDPGPGNPRQNNEWHRNAAAYATVLLANEEEANRLAGTADAREAAQVLLENGSELIVVKRGSAGCLLKTAEAEAAAPGYPVALQDATGAGDSVAGAVIYGYLRGMDLNRMAVLANATGAAKVQKRGTGRNMPSLSEIRALLERFSGEIGLLP